METNFAMLIFISLFQCFYIVDTWLVFPADFPYDFPLLWIYSISVTNDRWESASTKYVVLGSKNVLE